jgi:diphthine-ammonia ligase
MNVAVSWSGGKDGCFALYKAQKEGHKVSYLLTMMKDELTSGFHLIRADILDAQAEALGVPILKKTATLETYDDDFKAALKELKNFGVEALVTGDIFEVVGHEEGWLDRVCEEVGLKTIKPLWKQDTKQIFRDYLAAGFEAIVVRTIRSKLGNSWLGRKLNQDFYDEVTALGNVDVCGENGEYHTLVLNGPNFKSEIKIIETQKHKLDYERYGFLEIKQFTVIPKKGK